jgi:hypothetical protein
MQSESTKLKYAQARHLYLEIANYPIAVEKFREYGLSEREARTLADLIAEDVSNYEVARDGYQRDLWGGIVLTLIGIVAWVLISSPKMSVYSQLRMVRWTVIAGTVLLWRAYKKRKVIKTYERLDQQPY